MTLAAEPLEEQILAALVARLEGLSLDSEPQPWYLPQFVDRTYRFLDQVNGLPGYIVLRAPEESGMEPQTIHDEPDRTMLGTMGVEVMAYGAGSDAEAADTVVERLLAQAERVLLAPDLLGAGSQPWTNVENTRRVLDHEAEIGPPWRSVMSHLYRVRFFYTRGNP